MTELIECIEKEKIIAIVRGVSPESCLKVADALYEGGIRLMEITYDMQKPESFSQTAAAIRAIGEKYHGRMYVGAGTVTSTELVELTAASGGRFIISPNVNADVIHRTKELGLVSIPGAMTPTEILCAHKAGADFVKLFPASELGPSYLKAIRAPISNVKIIATGGINEKNIAEYLKAGAVGFGVGGNLANKQWILDSEFEKISAVSRQMIGAIQ